MNKKTLMPGKVIPASFDKVFKAVWQCSCTVKKQATENNR